MFSANFLITCLTSRATVCYSFIKPVYIYFYSVFLYINLDYDAPLTEAGDYSAKYDIISECLKLALPVMARLPDRPSESKKKAFKALPITSYLTLGDLIDQVVCAKKKNL